MATKMSHGSAILRMGVMYASSLASLLAGAHIVHMTMQPNMVGLRVLQICDRIMLTGWSF